MADQKGCKCYISTLDKYSGIRFCGLHAHAQELADMLKIFRGALIRYEWDVEIDAPPEHRNMMDEAAALLKAIDGEE